MAMDLYLSNCYNIAQAAAAKAAASSLTADRLQCDSSSQKNPIPEVGAAHLLNLPLGVKLPTNLSEKVSSQGLVNTCHHQQKSTSKRSNNQPTNCSTVSMAITADCFSSRKDMGFLFSFNVN
nr:fibrous sheath-interacting protein 2-like [Kogia breviceps]